MTKEEITQIGTELRVRGLITALHNECKAFRPRLSRDTVLDAFDEPEIDTDLRERIRLRAKAMLERIGALTQAA